MDKDGNIEEENDNNVSDDQDGADRVNINKEETILIRIVMVTKIMMVIGMTGVWE